MNSIQFPLAVLLLWKLIAIEKISMLSVKEISKFPHAEYSPFYLQILPPPDQIKVSLFSTETMVITIKDKNDMILEKQVFNYGYQYSIDEEFIGNFIDIPKWQRDINSTIINITILFKRNSNSKLIEIFHLPANTIETRREMLKNLKFVYRIYSNEIKLLIPSKLELSVKSINQSNDKLLSPDKLAVAICRAYDGIPEEKPIFTNHRSFNVTKSEYNIERNERKLWFYVSSVDHMKNMTCNAGNSFKSITILVLQKSIKIKGNKTKIDLEYYLDKVESLERLINKEVESLKSIINKHNQMHILHNNQYLINDITNMKINYLNISIEKLKMENKLLKQNDYKQFDSLIKNNNERIELLVEKNEKLNRTIQLIMKTMANNKTDTIKYQMTTVQSDIDKQNLLKTNFDLQLNWTIDNFSEIEKRKIHSKKFPDLKFDNNHNFDIEIWCWFYRKDFRVYFYVKSFPFKNRLISKIGIINRNNKNLYKELTKEFTVSKKDGHISPYFKFNYENLSKSGVLNGNSIIIRCYLLWVK